MPRIMNRQSPQQDQEPPPITKPPISVSHYSNKICSITNDGLELKLWKQTKWTTIKGKSLLDVG